MSTVPTARTAGKKIPRARRAATKATSPKPKPDENAVWLHKFIDDAVAGGKIGVPAYLRELAVELVMPDPVDARSAAHPTYDEATYQCATLDMALRQWEVANAMLLPLIDATTLDWADPVAAHRATRLVRYLAEHLAGLRESVLACASIEVAMDIEARVFKAIRLLGIPGFDLAAPTEDRR